MEHKANFVNSNADTKLEKASANTSRRSASSKPKRSRVPPRRMAAWMLRDLRSAAKVMRENGEIFGEANAHNWLLVGANILSSAPAGLDGTHEDASAPERIALNVRTLTAFASRCGFDVRQIADHIEDQVKDTIDWREKQTARSGHKHYVRISPDKIGELLGVTDEIREEAKAYTLGTRGGSPEAREKAARVKDRDRKTIVRRGNGVMPRADWLAAHSQSREQRWKKEGISESTWRRREKRRPEADRGVS